MTRRGPPAATPLVWSGKKAAEAFWKLNEIGHAERLYRAALDLAADDIYERELVLEGLIAMLEEHERSEEATELLRSELDRG